MLQVAIRKLEVKDIFLQLKWLDYTGKICTELACLILFYYG